MPFYFLFYKQIRDYLIQGHHVCGIGIGKLSVHVNARAVQSLARYNPRLLSPPGEFRRIVSRHSPYFAWKNRVASDQMVEANTGE